MASHKELKCNKKNAKYMSYTILVKGFCPLKIKITRFPDGFNA